MTDDAPLSFGLPAVCRKKLTVDSGGGHQCSDAGLLLLREAKRKLVFAGGFPTRCRIGAIPAIQRAIFEIAMVRVSAIACGYEDAIDLDCLRHDRMLKVAVGRCTGRRRAAALAIDYQSA